MHQRRSKALATVANWCIAAGTQPMIPVRSLRRLAEHLHLTLPSFHVASNLQGTL